MQRSRLTKRTCARLLIWTSMIANNYASIQPTQAQLTQAQLTQATAPQATAPEAKGQRFQVVVPSRIFVVSTPSRFQLQASVPIAMVATTKSKSGRIYTATQILYPTRAHHDLTITTESPRATSVVMTICPL